MLRQVKQHLDGSFTAVDETGRNVTIIESISFLFQVIPDETNNRVKYMPIDYRSPKILGQVEKFLTNKKHNKELIDTLVIRFGWMDKRLNKLSYMSLTEFMTLIRTGEATNTQKRKLGDLCKQLSLSMKNVLK